LPGSFFWNGAMGEATVLLERLNQGDQKAFDELVPLVYQELRGRAAFCLSGNGNGHTLEATALVHEAFLKLVGRDSSWKNSRHFYNAAAEVMRQILVSRARARKAIKRGGLARRVEFDDAPARAGDDSTDWEALDAALGELKIVDGRRHQVVMLRYFAGLTDAEVALALDVSEKTVQRDWATAKLFLREKMQNAGG
jgi:RNA polymerase sigma-70 factor, ECF subfamily